MARKIKVAAAQVGRVDRGAPRAETLARIIKLVEQAAAEGVKLVVLPELAFTTFFARIVGLDADPKAFDDWYEEGDIVHSKNVAALFARAKELGVQISAGYAEKTSEGLHYNTCSYVADGKELSKYRKVHLPGTFEPYPEPDAINQLEKRYFLPGDLGFKAFRAPGLSPSEKGDPIIGQMICNDRRWAEAWRCYGLQGVEIVCVGYNTANWAPSLWGHSKETTVEEAQKLTEFQHLLVMQAHSYTNATFSIASARAGYDDGIFGLIGASCIVHPEGHIIAQSKTMEDELVIAEIDLDDCISPKSRIFAFEKHRRTEHYEIITGQTGVVEPPLL